MRTMRSGCILLLFSVIAAACGGNADAGAGGLRDPVVRDSAGVRIVENRQASAAAWRAGAEARFTVGWAPDDPMFTWIQSGRILPDGGALLGDFGAGALYRVGPDGSAIGPWGRKGEGPGEYQRLDGIIVRGDSIVVSDGQLRRVTVLSREGEVLATRPLPGAFLHQVSSILSDGRLLLVPGEGYSAVAETRPEWHFETQPILAADLVAGTVDTLAVLPHLRRWYGIRGASPGPISVRGRAGGFPGGFAWARADEPEVRWYDGSGRLVQVARWDEDPAPLTPEWRGRVARRMEEAYRSQGMDEGVVSARLADLEEGFDRHGAPLPYWDAFHVDGSGNVWLREYSVPGQPSTRWRVVARDGVFIGWVELPEVIAILDVTDDRILAVRFDDVDVPAAVMLDLVEP
jgi:hypothetical protein